jgi:hypothetical protein
MCLEGNNPKDNRGFNYFTFFFLKKFLATTEHPCYWDKCDQVFFELQSLVDHLQGNRHSIKESF